MLEGEARSRAAYERFQPIFSNVRARYDAEDRAARTVAESIKVRIAAYLVESGLSTAFQRHSFAAMVAYKAASVQRSLQVARSSVPRRAGLRSGRRARRRARRGARRLFRGSGQGRQRDRPPRRPRSRRGCRAARGRASHRPDVRRAEGGAASRPVRGSTSRPQGAARSSVGGRAGHRGGQRSARTSALRKLFEGARHGGGASLLCRRAHHRRSDRCRA